jgi:Domain of unknown function (DUF4396)
VPLLRAGLALGAVIPIALASDTAGLDTTLLWGSLSIALVIAGLVAAPVNRWLIARGRGHAVVHQSGHHGDFPTGVVAVVAAVAAVFGTVVLLAELL